MPAEFDREAAFREWMAVAMPNLGPDGTAFVRIIWDAAERAAREYAAEQARTVAEMVRQSNKKHQWYGCNCEDVIDALAGDILAADPAARTGGT